MESTTWLEEELKKYTRILVIISHSQDFLNGVCTNIIHFHELQLKYYTGNYDQFVKTRAELEENQVQQLPRDGLSLTIAMQMKRFQSEQNQIADMKDYIARFGHGRLARHCFRYRRFTVRTVPSSRAKRRARRRYSARWWPAG